MRLIFLFHQWNFEHFLISETFRRLESQIDINAKGHHVHKDIWTPESGEILDAQIEPNKPVKKYAICIRKSGKIVGYLKKVTTSRFAETTFFFLKGDPYSKTKAITTGCRCSLGDGDVEDLQVLCKLKLACWSSKV